LKLKINYEKTNELREVIWGHGSSWGEEPHRSDAVFCPVKAYNRMIGMESIAKPKTVEIWVIGEALHNIVQSKFELTEMLRERKGTEVHIDIMWDKPAELKTTRMSIIKDVQMPREYIDQSRYGLVFLGELEGYLITLDIVNAVFLVWDIALTKEELKEAEDEYDEIMGLIYYAVNVRNPLVLTPRREECKDCTYEKCEMR